MADVTNDFFEEDEPVEKILTAFNQGEKGRTAQRSHGSAYLSVDGFGLAPAAANEPQNELVTH